MGDASCFAGGAEDSKKNLPTPHPACGGGGEQLRRGTNYIYFDIYIKYMRVWATKLGGVHEVGQPTKLAFL